MGIRGLLFGTKTRVVLTVVVLVVASVVGAYTLGIVGTPAVTGVENRFGSVDENETTIHTDLSLSNPNPVGVQLGGASVTYTVSMNDVEMARGGREGIDLPKGESTLAFTTRMDNGRIPAWWVSHIRNGERTQVTIDATAHSSTLGRSFDLPQRRTIETDIIGQFRSTEDRPVNANRPLLSDPVLVIRETDAKWGNVTERSTPIDTSFVVYNPKAVPYVVTEVGYNITMNDVQVGNGTTDRGYAIPGGTEKTLRATTAIDNRRLDEWWVSHLENDQRTELRIDFHAFVELPNGETVRVPLDALTYTQTIETDVFGTKNATADDTTDRTTEATTDGTSDEEATETADTTADESEPVTVTPTTTSDTATTTDTDGGLLGGSNGTTARAPTATPTDATSSSETTTGGTETDDGLLSLGRAGGSHGTVNLLLT